KLDMKGCELVEKKHLLAVEQKLKLAEEEIQMYKRRVEELQREMQETEDSFKYWITILEEVAQDNWVRMCFLPSLCAGIDNVTLTEAILSLIFKIGRNLQTEAGRGIYEAGTHLKRTIHVAFSTER
ncbi:Transport and Golgi organization protein 1-like protein, partial [Camelus dromedarius]